MIDRYLLRELSKEEWTAFRDDPPRYFIGAIYEQQAAIWREIEKRQ